MFLRSERPWMIPETNINILRPFRDTVTGLSRMLFPRVFTMDRGAKICFWSLIRLAKMAEPIEFDLMLDRKPGAGSVRREVSDQSCIDAPGSFRSQPFVWSVLPLLLFVCKM